MKICSTHWTQCRAAIDKRGIGHLVGNQESAVNRIKEELADSQTKKSYDPLLSLGFMLYGRALECGGLYLMTTKEDGSEYCPLCEFELRSDGGKASDWIDSAADACLKYCTENALQG